MSLLPRRLFPTENDRNRKKPKTQRFTPAETLCTRKYNVGFYLEDATTPTFQLVDVRPLRLPQPNASPRHPAAFSVHSAGVDPHPDSHFALFVYDDNMSRIPHNVIFNAKDALRELEQHCRRYGNLCQMPAARGTVSVYEAEKAAGTAFAPPATTCGASPLFCGQ